MKVEISNGDLVDKVTILHIKKRNITNDEQLKNINKEYALLIEVMNEAGIDTESDMFTSLLEVNANLWDIEDKIRKKEKLKEFDDEFIQLARSVYFANDARAVIKKNINIFTQSTVIEEKSYDEYSS